MQCPLCKSGALSRTNRDLAHGGRILRSEAFVCATCREVVLDAAQIESLRDVVRRETPGTSEEELDAIIERLLLQPVG